MINHRIESITEKILSSIGINSVEKINIKKVCRALEVDVKHDDLDSTISGLFVVKENKPFIRYNKLESNVRIRFTIAHELGHFVLHKDTPLFVDYTGEKIMFRNNDSSTGELKKEREANSFAASILMPREFIENEIKEIPKDTDNVIKYLAKRFKVSEQAMAYRLANLGYDYGYF